MPKDSLRCYLAFGVMVVAIIAMTYITPAWPHDAQGNANWIAEGAYKGKDNVHCCGVTDCPELAASEVRATNAGVLIIKTGEVVPWVEATPSEDGKIYRCHRYDGTRRCFFYPAGGS